MQDAGDSHAAARQRILEHLGGARAQTASPEPALHNDIDLSSSSPIIPPSLEALPPQQLHFAPGSGLSSPTISSGGSSPKSSSGAFASVVRRASLLRPNAARTKSTNDAPTPPPAPLVSPALESSPTRVWQQPTRSRSAAPEAAGMDNEVDVENRAPAPSSATTGAPLPRKLRKAKPSSPSIPSIRTDSDYLAASRPAYSPHLVYSPSGLSPVPPSSPNSQKRSWRRSFPIFSSAPSTPTAEHKEAELRRRERSPSPVGAFPSEVRRAAALPPVDSRRKKRTSTVSSSDSYLGDGEGSKPVGKKGSVASSSTSSSGGMWGAFKSSHKKGSVKSDDEWDEELLERSTSYEGLVVLSRPPVARSQSDPAVELERPKKGLAGASASSSSLNLDKIEEQAEDPTVSRQPSLRNLIAQEENTACSTSPPPSSFGTRTRTHSNTTASLATTSRAPSPTLIISAKSSHSALARTITPEHIAHLHAPTPATRITPTPLDVSSAPPSSASDSSSSPIHETRLQHSLSSSTSTVDSTVPPTPELVRSRREASNTSSSLSRRALSGLSESDLSMRSGETTPWDASEGEDTPASSAEHDDEEDEVLSLSGIKQFEGGVQVRVEGEGVVDW